MLKWKSQSNLSSPKSSLGNKLHEHFQASFPPSLGKPAALTLDSPSPLNHLPFLSHVPSSLLHSYTCCHFCLHPPLPYLSYPGVFLDFYIISHTCFPSLFLPTCSFHLLPVTPIILSTCSLKQVLPSGGLLWSTAAHSPGFALHPPWPLPSPVARALPFCSSGHKQTRLTGLPAFRGRSCHGNKSAAAT